MENFEFWNIELDFKNIKNISGDINLIADYIFKLSLKYLKNKNFSGNLYLHVIAIIKIARKIARSFKIYELCDLKSYSLFTIKQVEYSEEILKRSLNNFLYFSGTIKFKDEDFFGQKLSSEDFEFDQVCKIASLYQIVPSKKKNHIHNRHFQIDIYKKSVNDLFNQLAKKQMNLPQKIVNLIHLYIRNDIVKLSKSSENCNGPMTYFCRIDTHFIKSKEQKDNYLFVENQFLYKNNSVTIDFEKHPFNLILSPTIEDILRKVTEEVKVVYNINPNALLFFENISKEVMQPSRYEYFDFVTSFEIYEPFYRNL